MAESFAEEREPHSGTEELQWVKARLPARIWLLPGSRAHGRCRRPRQKESDERSSVDQQERRIGKNKAGPLENAPPGPQTILPDNQVTPARTTLRVACRQICPRKSNHSALVGCAL